MPFTGDPADAIAREQARVARLEKELKESRGRRVGHPIYRVKAFEIEGPYRLRIEFDDSLVRSIDFRPVLEGELYGPLRDLDKFNAVSLDREVHTLVWPNGADFDPATLHDWPEHEADMIALARRWAATGTSPGSTPH